MNVDIGKIRELADLAIEKNLAEVTVSDGDKTVTLKLPSSNVLYASPAQALPLAAATAVSPAPVAPAAAATAPKAASSDEHLLKVTAPMVGTFYAAPSPESPPFVSVGATISKGQTLCIIEAMKMMNELESEISGKIVKILVDNGKPVEFGQVIMLVEPG